jgi:hypothetical protein
MNTAKPLIVLTAILAAGCTAVPPSGPTVAAMPGTGKSLDAFRADDGKCRMYAAQANPNAPAAAQAATNNGVATALGGAALGAGAGALIGSAGAAAGGGAAIGAAAGLLAGTAIGANSVGANQYALQDAYNVAYAQCMTAAGNQVQQPSGPVVAGYPGPYPYAYGYPYAYVAPPPVIVEPAFGFGWGWRGGYRHW